MQRLVYQSKKHSPKEKVKVKVYFYFFNHKLNKSTNPIISLTKKLKHCAAFAKEILLSTPFER